MNTLTKTLFCCLLCLAFSCETEPTSTNNGAELTDPTEGNESTNSSTDSATKPTPNLQDCTIEETHFEQNVFLASDEAQLLSIIANESTKDPNLGDSHRILKVLNAKDCQVILEETLPINRSADFPYYLAPGTYDFNNQIVAIQGFSSLYYYHVKSQKLVGPIIPQFSADKEAVDAQSGMVKGLTTWEHYLLGHALDFGNFAYDITDPNSPEPIFPAVEFQIPNTSEYNNLFVLETADQNYQAIIPTQDLDAGGNVFDLYKLFKTPLPIDPTVAPNVRNNRFIIFNQKGNAAKVAVDMFKKKQVQLPENIANQNTSAILDWLKENG